MHFHNNSSGHMLAFQNILKANLSFVLFFTKLSRYIK